MNYRDNTQVIEELKKLTVRVQMLDEKEDVLKYGTGFFLDNEHIITANHVVSEAFDPKCKVKVLDSKATRIISVDAEVLHNKPKYDVNILRISNGENNNGVDYIGFVTNAYVEREFIYSAYGYPGSKSEGHYQKGIIIDQDEDAKGQNFIDVSLGEGRLNNYRGYSGSPVVCNGQLIGIAIEQSIGLNVAQSIKVLAASTFIDLLSDEWVCQDTFILQILEVFRNESEKEIIKNKANGKYIPEIFVELGDIKEYLRGFSDPVLFFEKHLDYVRRHRFEQYNKLLDKYGIRNIDVIRNENDVTLDNVDEVSNMIIPQLNVMLTYVTKLVNSSEIRQSVPDEYLELFDMTFFDHRLSSLIYEVKDRIKLFESLGSSQILLTEKAGQGKTNLLCDFTENVLLRKNIPCIFLSTRNLINNNLKDTIMSYFECIDKIDNLFKVLNFISDKMQVPFVIVLDAINEQEDLFNGKKALYEFLNKVKCYKHVRVLMTARTEYFEEKFGDINVRCPQIKLIDLYNRRSQHSRLNRRVFDGYMEHFQIQIDDINDSIYNQLSTDFLLLRMFSEAYQGSRDEKTIIPSLSHLFRYEIFERYYKYKRKNLKEWDRLKGRLDTGSTYDNLVDLIIKYMIKNMQFSNIERSVIVDKIQNDLLVKLIDEDIIFREDILRKKGLLESEVEVINFTFDEFRDFCIAKNIMKRFNEEAINEYEILIKELTSQGIEASEGIQKYLFFASKKLQNKTFTQIISKQEWFYNIFFNNIFSVSEEYLEERDIKYIIKLLTNFEFYDNHYSIVLQMYINLIKRYNTSVYQKLNIRTLITILDEINDGDFRHYIHDIFKSSHEDRYYFEHKDRIHIDELVIILKKYFVKSFSSDIILFLGYLNMRGVYIDDFFYWCMEEYPLKTINILEKFSSSTDKIEIEVSADIVKNLSYDDFSIEEKLLKRWEKIKVDCKESKQLKYDINEFSGLKFEEIIKRIDKLGFKEEE